MSDSGADDEGKVSAANVWARGGEGPHELSMPTPASLSESPSASSPAALPESLSGSPPESPSASSPAALSESLSAAPPVSNPDVTRKISGVHTDLHDLVVMAGEAQSAVVTENTVVNADAAAGPEANASVLSDNVVEDNDNDTDGENNDEEEDEQPVSDGTPGQNDIAFGYLIPLVLFFVGYAGNYLAGGYCLSSEKMNALAQVAFLWTPAVGALCLLMGTRTLKIVGAILFLPLATGAVFAGQYFHSYERFQTEQGPYGPLVKAYDANNWRICRYESSWTSGNMPGITYTRERDVAPYVVYVKKMKMGEPP